jgi:hypothetical protein
MFKVERFIVRRQATGATVGDPEVFLDEISALRRGSRLGRRALSRVYRVVGEPASDIWDEPQLIAEFDPSVLAEPIAAPISNVLRFEPRLRATG